MSDYDWISAANQMNSNWIAMRDSQYRHEIDEKTLAQNEKLALAQLDLAEREYYSNIDIMNRNFGFQQAAFDYNKKQAELTRMREDNAFQRRVQDTINAGFSPLAAQGSSAASQAPTLTAPQLDPQGVNQATSNRLNAYNSAMENNNVKAQLKLQNQQLKLAQIETLTETIAAVQNLRSQNIINQQNMHQLKWYEEHGYRDTTMNTILSDILKGVNYKGRSIGQLGSDGINFVLDKILNSPVNTERYNTGNKFSFSNPLDSLSKTVVSLDKKSDSKSKEKSKSSSKEVKEGYKLSEFQKKELFNSLKRARDGLISPVEIDFLREQLWKHFHSTLGLPYGRWKSLTQEEYESILRQITERLK